MGFCLSSLNRHDFSVLRYYFRILILKYYQDIHMEAKFAK